MTAVTTDYPQPVTVNGYSCRNCTDVSEAKKHIDPAHPKSGPYGIDAASDPTQHGSAVKFGGALAGLDKTSPDGAAQATNGAQRPGQVLDLAA